MCGAFLTLFGGTILLSALGQGSLPPMKAFGLIAGGLALLATGVRLRVRAQTRLAEAQGASESG